MTARDLIAWVICSARGWLDVDESQYDAGYGPCLDAIRLGLTIIVDDQATEPRWPEYTPKAAEAGVGSSLSVPLAVDDRHCRAFSIYSLSPHAFDATAVERAQELAGYASIVSVSREKFFAVASLAAVTRPIPNFEDIARFSIYCDWPSTLGSSALL